MSTTTLIRDMPDGHRVVGTFTLRKFDGNEHAYFSATGEVYEPFGRMKGAERHKRGLEPDSSGMIHDELRTAFPMLRPFIDLHLAEYPSGLPMHAVADAEYHLEHDNPAAAARLLRCLEADLVDLEGEGAVAAYVAAQAGRYGREAQDAAALLTTGHDRTDVLLTS